MKNDIDPMQAANAAPRCKAKSKRTGQPCKNPAVRGWTVCRMHGARGGHKAGPTHPTWKHGARSQEAISALRFASLMHRNTSQLMTEIEGEKQPERS